MSESQHTMLKSQAHTLVDQILTMAESDREFTLGFLHSYAGETPALGIDGAESYALGRRYAEKIAGETMSSFRHDKKYKSGWKGWLGL
jgi:hypothetical protein